MILEQSKVTPHISSLGKDGTSKHPLYLKETLKPFIWKL